MKLDCTVEWGLLVTQVICEIWSWPMHQLDLLQKNKDYIKLESVSIFFFFFYQTLYYCIFGCLPERQKRLSSLTCAMKVEQENRTWFGCFPIGEGNRFGLLVRLLTLDVWHHLQTVDWEKDILKQISSSPHDFCVISNVLGEEISALCISRVRPQ